MEENNQQQNKNKLSGLHTFQSDMAEFVRDENASVADIVLAQKKERLTDSYLGESKNSKFKNIFYLFLSFIIIIIAIFGSIFLVKQGKKNAIVKKEVIKVQTFVSYEDGIQLDLFNSIDKKALSNKLREEVDKILSPGKIKFILLNTANPDDDNSSGIFQQMKVSEFVEVTKINMPQNLLASLSDKFMVGVFSPTGNSEVSIDDRQNSLFMIFKIKNYEGALIGMLDWEKTMMDDLFLFFNIDISEDNQKILTTLFKDKIISNKDSRVIENIKREGVLYYLFIDTDTLIISDSQDAIKEVISRIIVKNIKPL